MVKQRERKFMEEKTIGERSQETRAIMERLRALKIGEFINYIDLSDAGGRPVRAEGRHALYSARQILLREEGICFDVLPAKGLRRMTDPEIVKQGTRGTRMVHLKAKHEIANLAAVANFGALSNEDQIRHNATLSVLGAVSHFTRPAQVKILEAAVEAARERLPVADTMEAIRLALAGGNK